MKKVLEFFVDQGLFVNILTVVIILAGLMTFIQLPREIFPNVSFDIVTVTTVYPGATAQEVENLVTNVVEDKLRGVNGLKEVWGTSIEHQSIITLILDPNIHDKKKVVDDIKAAIDRINDLPEDVDPPLVFELESKDQPILEVALSGDVPYAELRKTAQNLAKVLEDIPSVTQIQKRGYYDQEIWVEADPNQLKQFHVSLAEINQAIFENNISIPGGLLKDPSGHDIIIRTDEQVKTPQDVSNIILRKSYDGRSVKISDVATVKNTYADQTKIYRTNSNKGINLQVIKKEGADAINLVEAVRREATKFSESLTSNINIQYVNDYSFFVSRRLRIIGSNGLIGICLVLIILFLFLNNWVAIWTAAAIPLSIAIAIYIGAYFGVTINLISLLALLVVLGIVVDDSIVVGENIFRHMENGLAPNAAAKKGLLEVAKPVTATIITTIAAFSPLLFMPGIMGKFIWAIPVVIILSLVGSWLESFTILPNHMSDLIPNKSLEKIRQRGKNRGASNDIHHWLLTPIREKYIKMLSKAIDYRYRVFGVASLLLLSSIILVKSGLLPFILFESRGIEVFFVRVEGPTSASLEKTERALMKVEETALNVIQEHELDFMTTTVGETTQGGHDPYRVVSSHVGQVQIRVTAAKNRDRSFEEIVEAVRHKIESTQLDGFKVKFERVKPGPPVGKALSLQITGTDLKQLKILADQVQSEVSTIEGVTDLSQSLLPGKEEWIVKVNKEKAANLNVSIPQIARTVQSAIDGYISSTIRTVEEETEIRTRLKSDYRIPDQSIILALTVPNRTGQLIPLSSLVTFQTRLGYLSVLHSEWERYAMVGGNIDESITNSVEVNKHLQKKYKNFNQEHPGYRLKFKGEYEETQESLHDLIKMFVIAFCIIFLIIATTFQSLLQPFVIMACIPFAFIGVCIAFLLHGLPLGFLAMIGVIGLLGIVVNDSIIYTEFINNSLKSGKALLPAIKEAGKQRIRPILLTTFTTVFGLLPTAYGIGGYDPFLVPLCLSISWGLAFGTFITLFLLPCLFAIANDFRGFCLKKGYAKK
jgi:multidrug efflux pump subunit AcrB